MHDLKLIRTTPDLLDNSQVRRGKKKRSQEVLDLDTQHRQMQTELQDLQTRRNQIAQQFGEAKKKGEDTSTLSIEAEKIKLAMGDLEEQTGHIHKKLTHLLSLIPNLAADDVPEGLDESGNVEIRRVGTPRVFDFTPLPHYDLGENLGLIDFERATKISGSRFVVLYSELARLERALAAFMIDHHIQKYGYTEVYTPLLVNDKAAYGTGNLPKSEEDMFKTNTGHWLIPTSEMALTNLVSEEILPVADLPIRYTSYTPCFRSEAGAAGRDTRGMIRLHQFGKVEMVSITTTTESVAEHERMTEAAESILQQLKLPYRVMTLCAGDMGFQAQKTYDLEVWIPSQNTYREISSCSNCGSFQGRRMNTRFRPQPTTAHPKPATEFVHTLNGSGLAVGRTMVAILENYQQADGCILIPDVLIPYMGGIEVIQKKK